MKPRSRHLPPLNGAKIQFNSLLDGCYSLYCVIFKTEGVRHFSFELYNQLKFFQVQQNKYSEWIVP